MKCHPCLLLTLLLLSASAGALERKTEIVEQFDSLRVVAFVDSDDIAASPEWNPGAGNPPLSIAEAIAAIGGSAHNSAAIRRIELRRIPHEESRWHYLIRKDNDAKFTRYDIFIVLMSGKVIPAIIEPQS